MTQVEEFQKLVDKLENGCKDTDGKFQMFLGDNV